MGEALIIRSGGGYSNGGYVPKTEIITNNYSFKVPNAKGQQFAVRIFGGGGGGFTTSGGGGGGNMNYAVLTLNEGDIIPIIIGDGGNNGSKSSQVSNGGTTSFGEYLSATGGEAGSAGQGGNGGTGGGGGLSVYGGSFFRASNGGHGFYGGGGGASVEFEGKWVIPDNTPTNFYDKNGNKYRCIGGNGGTYGGGGGGYFPGISVGGWGNGADIILGNEQNGLNTMNIVTELDFVGNGEHGGANTFTWQKINSDYGRYYFNGKLSNNIGSGGGGYGGRGGNSAIMHSIQNKYNGYGSWEYAGGGGGGFGANGGDAGKMSGGGGGGYGGRGGSGEINMTGFSVAGGYGGGYGPDGYGHGYGTNDGSNNKVSAMPGICIISYMQTLQS